MSPRDVRSRRSPGWGLARLGRLLGCAALLAFIASPALAQEPGRITGTVTNAGNAQPLAGAQVFIEGTNQGTITNEAGRFLILNVDPGSYTLRVQMIGFEGATEEITVAAGGSVSVDFELSETAVSLDELVVTGTAVEVRRKEIANSLDALTSRDIEVAPVTNAQDALAGRAPGVTFMQSSGQPGAGGTIKIRGTSSVSQDTEPLIYVDGVRIFNLPTRNGWGGRTGSHPLQDINPDDIERIEIVKGAAATTIYGTEASAGVIQIFTKKGVSGEPRWTAEVTTGFSQMGRFGPASDETMMYTRCSGTMRGIITSDDPDTPENELGTYQEFVDPTCPEDGDWWQVGPQQKYHISVRGGAGDVTYYISGNFGNSDGVLPTMNSKEGGFRGNFSFSPVEDLTFSLNTSYTRRNTRFVGDGNNSSGFLLNVGRGYRNYLKGGKGDDCANVPDGVICTTNRYLFDDSRNFTRNDHFISGFVTQYNPTENLSNRLAIGWDYTLINNETTLLWNNLDEPPGYYWDENTLHTKLSLDYTGSFQSQFGEDIASTFSWGGQIFRDFHRWTEIDVGEFAGPGTPTLETGALMTYRADDPFEETSAGFFLQEVLGWKDRLFVTAGLRVDGHSAFGDNFGLQQYPKVSVAYVLSDHDFWPMWWETFKLRAAMGESGKAPPTFAKLRTWTPIAGDEAVPGFTPLNVGNDEVGPERTREIEAGFDLGMFDGRFGLEFTAYQARTFDALVGVTVPPSTGFLAARTSNIGELKNEGLEFQITGDLIRTEAIDWSSRVNLTFMRSEAIDLGGEEIFADNKAEFREGYPAPTYFGDLITNPNEFADPVIVRDTVLGNVFPTKLVGFGTTLTLFGNLTLDALAEYQGGHYLPNYTGYQNARRGAWQPCFDIQRRATAGDPLNDVTALWRARCSLDDYDSDYWVEKADFVKLRTVSLTYNLPTDIAFLNFARNASITLSGRNLFTWTDYSGTDPEVEDFADRAANVFDGNGDFGRRDYYQIPPPRTFLLSLRFGF